MDHGFVEKNIGEGMASKWNKSTWTVSAVPSGALVPYFSAIG